MSSVIYILYSLLLFSEDCRVIFSNHLLPYVPSDICNKEGSSTQVARGILHCSERLWRLRTSATSVLVLEKRYQNVKSIGDVTKSSRHYVKHGVWSVSKAVRWSSRSAEATEPIYQKNMPLLGLDERTGSQKVSKKEGYWELRTGELWHSILPDIRIICSQFNQIFHISACSYQRIDVLE